MFTVKNFFVLFLSISACAAERSIAVNKQDIVSEKSLPEIKTLSSTNTEEIEAYIKEIELLSWRSEPPDQATIEVILKIIARADSAELQKIVLNDEVFPILDRRLALFWNDLLRTAFVFQRYKKCEEREMFQELVATSWQIEARNRFLVTARFLETRAHREKYFCVKASNPHRHQITSYKRMNKISSRSSPFTLSRAGCFFA